MTETHELATLTPEQRYAAFHAKRFAYLIKLAQSIAPHARTVLDVGRGPFTHIARDVYPKVWTLDLNDHDDATHISYDFNTIVRGVRPTVNQTFDLIFFSEVVEHLHIPPRAALEVLRDMLADKGMIILQTPNAAEIMKRVALMRGVNPFEPLRMTPDNPGHFRENTVAELTDEVEAAGLRIVSTACADYFPMEKVGGFHPVRRVLDVARRLVPTFRSGITMVLTTR